MTISVKQTAYERDLPLTFVLDTENPATTPYMFTNFWKVTHYSGAISDVTIADTDYLNFMKMNVEKDAAVAMIQSKLNPLLPSFNKRDQAEMIGNSYDYIQMLLQIVCVTRCISGF
jgi:hypothetical protein